MQHIKIGSRGSKLALWQANYASSQLSDLGISSEIVVIKTQGDRIQDLSFQKLEGKGFFTKELEEALLNGSIDLAIHSHKDLPTANPPGLVIGAVSYREDPADVLLINKNVHDPLKPFGLPEGTVVGTSSARRKAQLLENCQGIELKDIRGNVPTRIAKLQQGDFDAIVLAQAGLNRLEIEPADLVMVPLRVDRFIPAPAQGVLAYQCRAEDAATQTILRQLHEPEVAAAISAERNLLSLLDGGCQLPMGAHCRQDKSGRWEFFAALADAELSSLKQVYVHSMDSPAGLGERALEKLRNEAPKRIFISRDLSEQNSFVQSLRRHNIPVRAESLLQFKALQFTWPEATDWVFFSSRTAVRAFLRVIGAQSISLQGNPKFAAIGSGTAKELLKGGIQADFVADPFDLDNSLESYLNQIEGRTVTFPAARNSLRSVQLKAGDRIKAMDVAVYDNLPRTDVRFPIDEDVVVLTSPMNAKVFLEGQQLADHQRVVAIGPTTAAALQEMGVEKVHTSRRPGEFGLLEAIWSL